MSDVDEKPTLLNIIAAIMWLVEGASPGDSLFLHYSGHGGKEMNDIYHQNNYINNNNNNNNNNKKKKKKKKKNTEIINNLIFY